MHEQCKKCLKLKEKEETNISWSEEPDSTDIITEALKGMECINNEDSNNVYKCRECGQEYWYISWNELFGDGWVEFSQLRKISR